MGANGRRHGTHLLEHVPSKTHPLPTLCGGLSRSTSRVRRAPLYCATFGLFTR